MVWLLGGILAGRHEIVPEAGSAAGSCDCAPSPRSSVTGEPGRDVPEARTTGPIAGGRDSSGPAPRVETEPGRGGTPECSRPWKSRCRPAHTLHGLPGPVPVQSGRELIGFPRMNPTPTNHSPQNRQPPCGQMAPHPSGFGNRQSTRSSPPTRRAPPRLSARDRRPAPRRGAGPSPVAVFPG